jgi:hypothetical protein
MERMTDALKLPNSDTAASKVTYARAVVVMVSPSRKQAKVSDARPTAPKAH